MRDILPPESGVGVGSRGCSPRSSRRPATARSSPRCSRTSGCSHRVGDATDVVSKEMYDFVDKGERHISLRPEMTASVCRSFAQHRPTVPWKVYYAGSNFRYEKPQRGRYRQFDQVGIEVLGVDDAAPRRRGDRPRRGTSTAALGLRQVAPDRQQPRRARRAGPLRRGAADVLRRPPATRSPNRAGRRSNGTRCGCSTRSASRTQAVDRRSADDRRLPRRRIGSPLRHGAGRARRARHPVRRRTEARARPRLLPAHDLRVPGRHARLGPERARRRRPLRRPGRGARRAADAGRRLRPRARPHAAGLRRRGRVRRRRAAARRVRRRHHRRARGDRASPPSSAPPGSPPTAATTTAR